MASEEFGGLESLQVLLQQNPNSLTFGHVANALQQQDRLDGRFSFAKGHSPTSLLRHRPYRSWQMLFAEKAFRSGGKEFKRY
jgi:hypothetical protein